MDRIDISSIPADRRRELLEDHEDTTTVTIGGTEYKVFLGGASFGIAREEGIDLAGVMAAGEEMAEEGAGSVEDAIDQAAYLLFVGIRPFDEEITPAEIKLQLSLESLQEVMEQIMPEVEGLEGGALQAGEAGSPRGKGDPAPASA